MVKIKAVKELNAICIAYYYSLVGTNLMLIRNPFVFFTDYYGKQLCCMEEGDSNMKPVIQVVGRWGSLG